MIYYTGDIHGDVTSVLDHMALLDITSDDLIVILGDVGLNYYGNKTDKKKKKLLNNGGVEILCIHGNHEMRPHNIDTYTTKMWKGGIVYYEPEYPNLLFAKDGEIFDLDGRKTIVIGGAYSVDKEYRLMRGYSWFADEQPDAETKDHVYKVLEKEGWNVDQVLSHTCPFKYIPREAFITGIDQSAVDNSTENFLDMIEDKLTYKRWFCGHWHIDKKIDDMIFVMDDYII